MPRFSVLVPIGFLASAFCASQVDAGERLSATPLKPQYFGPLVSRIPQVLEFLGNGDQPAGLCQRSLTL